MLRNAEMNEALKSLKDYWFILMFIGTIVVGWVQFDGRISQSEKDISLLKSQYETQNITLNNMQNNLVEIKTTLEFIKNNLNR